MNAPGNPEKNHVKFSTELKGHSGSIEKVAFNPTKDAELCSVSSDGVVKFWDVRSKACFNEVKGLGDALSLVWAPDGQSLLVGNKVCSSFSLPIRFRASDFPWLPALDMSRLDTHRYIHRRENGN